MSKLTSAERLTLWTERFERFRSSQVTVAEFCRRESVSVATFYRWKEQLNLEPDSRRPGKRSNRSNAKFVPVIVQATSPTPKLSFAGRGFNRSSIAAGQRATCQLGRSRHRSH